MASIQDVSAETLAKLLQDYETALAGDFECQGERQFGSSWEQTPHNQRKLKIAAARLALLELASTTRENTSRDRYFAKPGEADWGC